MPLSPVSSTWAGVGGTEPQGSGPRFPFQASLGGRRTSSHTRGRSPGPGPAGKPCSACPVERERQAHVLLAVPLAEDPSLLPRGSMYQSVRTRSGQSGQTDRHTLQRVGSGEAHAPGPACPAGWGAFRWGCSGPTARLSQSSSCLERRAKPTTACLPLTTAVHPAAAPARAGWASRQPPWGRRC